jgi:hypothetical protein
MAPAPLGSSSGWRSLPSARLKHETRVPIFVERLERCPVRCDACRHSQTSNKRSTRVVRAHASFPAYALFVPSVMHDYADVYADMSASASSTQNTSTVGGSVETFALSEVDVKLRSASEVERIKLGRHYGNIILGVFHAIFFLLVGLPPVAPSSAF